jgi:hypothetical protein
LFIFSFHHFTAEPQRLLVEKSSPKTCAKFSHFQVTAQSKQSPIGRIFALFWSPCTAFTDTEKPEKSKTFLSTPLKMLLMKYAELMATLNHILNVASDAGIRLGCITTL